jgi:hypothetical protein
MMENTIYNKLFFILFIFFSGVCLYTCFIEKEWTPELFVNEIVPINSTEYAIILEKYGAPDKIDEFIYDYDPMGKVTVLYYGDMKFQFYNNKEYEINHPLDWEMENNFNKYFSLFNNNNISKDKIINTFKKNNHREFNIDDKYYCGYKLEDSELIFEFKSNKLTKIIWTTDR